MQDKSQNEQRGFRKLRRDAINGDVIAVRRLREHVQKRLRAGWRIKTVAARLGLTSDEVIHYAGDALVSPFIAARPRLRSVFGVGFR